MSKDMKTELEEIRAREIGQGVESIRNPEPRVAPKEQSR